MIKKAIISLRYFFILPLLSLVMCSLAAFGQSTPSTGLTQFGSFEGSPDSVNLGNLNVHLGVPIRHKPGRGLNFAYDLTFDSSVWNVASNAWSLNKTMGWAGTSFSPSTSSTNYSTSVINQTVCITTTGKTVVPGQWINSGPGESAFGGYLEIYYNYNYTDLHGVIHYFPGVISQYHCGGSGTGGSGPATDSFTYGASAVTQMQIGGSNPNYTFTPVTAGPSGAFGFAPDGSGISATINSSVQGACCMPFVEVSVPGIHATLVSVSASGVAQYQNNLSVTYPGEFDRNGNEIISYTAANPTPSLAVTEGTSATSIYDTLGQVALTISESNTTTMQLNGQTVIAGGFIDYSYPGGNGSNSVFAMHYSAFSVQTKFGCPGITEANTTEVMPDYLLLPDGRKYSFAYERTPGSSNSITGRMALLTLPAGGSVAYTYGNPNCDGTVASLTRTISDGEGHKSVWQYASSKTNGNWVTTETDPIGNQKVITFWVGASGALYESNRLEYSGTAATGTLLRTTSTASAGASSDVEPILQRTVTTMLPSASGKSSQVIYTYDLAGSNTGVSTYDFGPLGGGPGNLLTSTTMSYQLFGGSFEQLVSDTTETAYPNAPPSVVIHVYVPDTAPLVTSGVQLQPPLTSRGNVTIVSTTALNPQTNQSSSMTKNYTYYDTGEVATATDASGAVTTYSYSQCESAFPTAKSQTVKPSGIVLTSSTSWNCIGGVPTSATDVNGNTVTSVHADPLWRLTGTVDALGNTSTVTYPTAASNMSSLSMTYADNLPSTTSLTTYDGLGRPLTTQAQQGPGASTYTTTARLYDPRGPLSWVSNPYTAASGIYTTTGVGSTSTYDALLRLSSTTDAGGGTATWTYNLNDEVVTRGPAASGEHVKARQLEYNGAGQLMSVCEITSVSGSGSCSQSTAATGYLTQYTYSGPLLMSVSQNAQAGSSGLQTRVMSYDVFGRKISETIPETGSSSFTLDQDATGICPAVSIGDVVKSVDNAGDVTCFTYDSLHRRLSSSVVSGPFSALTAQTHVIYDTASLNSSAMLNVLGSVAEAYTCTAPCSSKSTDVLFSNTYEMSGGKKTGRTISQIYESTPHSNGYSQISGIASPNGTSGALSGSGPGYTLPSIVFGLDSEGRLSSASDTTNAITLVSSTAYNQLAGTVAQVNLGNGDSDSFTYDANTNRPTAFKYSVGGASPFSITGAMTWNANSSLQVFKLTDSSDASKTQNCGYSMDDLNRLASVNCAASWAQTFTYDPFGNISKGPPSNPQAGQITQSYPAVYNSPTNRATSGVSATYDVNGNQTLAETTNLTWNAAGQPVLVNGVAATYDALGRLVEISSSGGGAPYTQFVYSPGGHKTAIVTNGALSQGFVPLPGGSTAVYKATGFNYFRHKDWLGSSRLSTTWGHNLYGKEAYAPFGETYNEVGKDRSFTGEDQDTASGIYDFPSRKYDPIAGRWLSPDPSGWAAVSLTHPQSLDRYAYVQNNPLVLYDPNGLDACVYGDGQGGINVQTYDPDVSDACDAGDGDDGYYVPGDQLTAANFTLISDTGVSDDGQQISSYMGPTGVINLEEGQASAAEQAFAYIGAPITSDAAVEALANADAQAIPYVLPLVLPELGVEELVGAEVAEGAEVSNAAANSGFGTTTFGNEVHAGFGDVLAEQTGTDASDWQMATAPGQTGVDATYVGPESTNPGFNYAELKPAGSSPYAVGNQIGNWGLPEGQTSIWWYNAQGIIGQTSGVW